MNNPELDFFTQPIEEHGLSNALVQAAKQQGYRTLQDLFSIPVVALTETEWFEPEYLDELSTILTKHREKKSGSL